MSNNAIDSVENTQAIARILLFVSGNDVISAQAIKTITEVCETDFKQKCQLEIIDIEKNIEAALQYNVIVIPMLLVEHPKPGLTIVGSLRDREKILSALQLLGL